jgi:hypothetical protein
MGGAYVSAGAPDLEVVRATLAELLADGDRGQVEVVAPAARPVARLGLALAPPAGGLDDLDALVLHRARGFAPPPGLGVLGCHDPFDHRLGLAHNPWLHARLGLRDGAQLAPKATVHTAPADLAERVTGTFGGREGLHAGDGRPVARAVLADALRPELVRAAAGAGASLYVTGTWRVPAAEAIGRTGLTVLLVGHARQERWSLGLLAELLRAELPAVDVRTR